MTEPTDAERRAWQEQARRLQMENTMMKLLEQDLLRISNGEFPYGELAALTPKALDAIMTPLRIEAENALIPGLRAAAAKMLEILEKARCTGA